MQTKKWDIKENEIKPKPIRNRGKCQKSQEILEIFSVLRRKARNKSVNTQSKRFLLNALSDDRKKTVTLIARNQIVRREKIKTVI